MAGTFDIEITRLHRTKHTLVILLVIALAIILYFTAFPRANTTTQYGGTKTGTNVFLLPESQADALKNGITTDGWSVSVGTDVVAGTTLEKNAVIENQAADAYMRVNFQVIDKSTNTVLKPSTDRARLEKILGFIFYDRGSALSTNSSYTQAELNEIKGNNRIIQVCNTTDFSPVNESSDVVENGWNSTANAYSFNYTNSNTLGVFTKSSTSRFFTNIVIPSDISSSEIEEVGDFNINVWVQAVSTQGKTKAEAFSGFN